MSERRSVISWLHLVLTITLAGALLTIGVLVGRGKVESRQGIKSHI